MLAYFDKPVKHARGQVCTHLTSTEIRKHERKIIQHNITHVYLPV